jgi:hypothetical protein
MTNDLLIYGENICAFPHILGNPFSYTVWLCTRLQWFSQLYGIHQQKDAKYYSLKCLFKKFFKWFSHFLRICIILFPKNTHICTPWPHNIFISFLTYEYPKNAEFYADFKSVEIIWKKCTKKKLFPKNFYKLVVGKSTNSNFAHFFCL